MPPKAVKMSSLIRAQSCPILPNDWATPTRGPDAAANPLVAAAADAVVAAAAPVTPMSAAAATTGCCKKPRRHSHPCLLYFSRYDTLCGLHWEQATFYRFIICNKRICLRCCNIHGMAGSKAKIEKNKTKILHTRCSDCSDENKTGKLFLCRRFTAAFPSASIMNNSADKHRPTN